jgi:hypothetical protein
MLLVSPSVALTIVWPRQHWASSLVWHFRQTSAHFDKITVQTTPLCDDDCHPMNGAHAVIGAWGWHNTIVAWAFVYE